MSSQETARAGTGGRSFATWTPQHSNRATGPWGGSL